MIYALGYVLIFIAGALIGSFLNVVSDRVPNGESSLKGRSHCDRCKKTLAPKDMFPILSFILLKGRCRYCQAKLSRYYPLSELLTGLSFVGLAYYINVLGSPTPLVWGIFAYMAVVTSFFIVLLLTDLKFRLLPNKIVYSAIFFVLFVMIGSIILMGVTSYLQLRADAFGQYLLEAGYWHNQMLFMVKGLGSTLLMAFAIAAFFYILILITKGKGMGGGDVKLGFLIGLVNGFPLGIIAIILGFVIGAVYSLGLVAVKRKGMKDTIAFGPFLILGSALAFVYGQRLFEWYIGLI